MQQRVVSMEFLSKDHSFQREQQSNAIGRKKVGSCIPAALEHQFAEVAEPFRYMKVQFEP
jgi:hypothetical protein